MAPGFTFPAMPPRPAPPIPATSAGKTNVFLVDGYALIYRAFFAMIARPLTTKSGENTSAVWGITNFLLRLYDNYHPEYIGWVHDRGVSFRQEQYPEYKATREKLGEELQQDFDRSLERVCQILDAFHIPVIALTGYEADDVVATLADRAATRGLQAVIVSGDKDFYQLIAPGIALLNPGRGGQAAVEEQWVDQSNASERLGVPPERVVDYLALVGDTSDNIPGVKGIGDKTAVQLLETYGDLDTILTKAPDIPGKRPREALLQQADNARLSRQLVTLRRDVPVELDLEQLRVRAPDTDTLARLFTELEFRTLIPKLGDLGSVGAAPAPGPAAAAEPGAAASPPPPPAGRAPLLADPTIVDESAALAPMIQELRDAQLVALQAEPGLVGISFAVASGRSWYLPFGHVARDGEFDATPPRNLPSLAGEALAPLRALLADPTVRKAGHDIKAAWVALARAGLSLAGVAYDSMVASFVLDPGNRSHAIHDLAREHLSVELPITAQLLGKGKGGAPERTFAQVPPAEAARVSAAQAEMVLRLEAAFSGDIEAHHLKRLLDEIEIPLIPVLVDMEATGILVDRVLLGEMSRGFNKELKNLELDIYKAAGGEFNIGSTPQLRTVLFERLKLPVQKRTKTGASTDVEVLEQLAAMGHEVPRLLIEYRELSKLQSTYVDALPGYINAQTGRVHTSFNQTGAATGRLSSSNPNLQNIPVRTPRGGEIRRAFVAPPGHLLLTADYSQVELRLLAHLSEDPAFVAAFQRGGDIHRQTAAVIFGVPEERVTGEMRARAKTINFATIYGQGALALSRQLGITLDEAKAFIKQYFERFAGVRAWLDRTIDEARQRGFVETLFGRRRYIPELRDRNFSIRAFGERTATNSPLQGSAADLIKIAMIRIHAALDQADVRAKMLLQVHDELVFEIPEAERAVAAALVKREMEGVASLRVPLVVSVGAGKNWIDAKG
ncbi:MAG: DNA polymerase I [Gemmatimonadetes bacterium]|nr:MAG: DNA polymerase I [Gemmatimonadota bacterium]